MPVPQQGSQIPLFARRHPDREAVSCESGDTLAKEQADAPTKESVLQALDKVASSLRAKLGESLASVQKFDVPVEATTPSLEALKTFSLGIRAMREKGDPEAAPFFKRAIEVDPNFALAYVSLGISYSNLGEATLAAENIKKAYELRTTSAKERNCAFRTPTSVTRPENWRRRIRCCNSGRRATRATPPPAATSGMPT